MIRRILVPLDGSELAERALLVAGNLAESLAGTLILARVVPPPMPGASYAPSLLQQLDEAQTQEAEAYLTSTAERVRQDRLEVDTRLLHGEVAPTLVAAAGRERCDLIAISSHGTSGLGSQVFGSVAQKLLYSAPCPVLVVRSTQEQLELEEEQEERAADASLLARIEAVGKQSGARDG